jgi:hypothetical protein
MDAPDSVDAPRLVAYAFETVSGSAAHRGITTVWWNRVTDIVAGMSTDLYTYGTGQAVHALHASHHHPQHFSCYNALREDFVLHFTHHSHEDLLYRSGMYHDLAGSVRLVVFKREGCLLFRSLLVGCHCGCWRCWLNDDAWIR